MADLPIKEIDVDIGQAIAMAAAQHRKVEEWCEAQGIESESDLALMFTSHAEALRAAGRAVADAWSASRVNVQRGLAGRLRRCLRRWCSSVLLLPWYPSLPALRTGW